MLEENPDPTVQQLALRYEPVSGAEEGILLTAERKWAAYSNSLWSLVCDFFLLMIILLIYLYYSYVFPRKCLYQEQGSVYQWNPAAHVLCDVTLIGLCPFRYAMMENRQFLEYMIATNYTNKYGEETLHVMRECFLPFRCVAPLGERLEGEKTLPIKPNVVLMSCYYDSHLWQLKEFSLFAGSGWPCPRRRHTSPIWTEWWTA